MNIVNDYKYKTSNVTSQFIDGSLLLAINATMQIEGLSITNHLAAHAIIEKVAIPIVQPDGLDEQDRIVETSVEEVMDAFFATEPQYENLYRKLAGL
jgi:hypothetical protein